MLGITMRGDDITPDAVSDARDEFCDALQRFAARYHTHPDYVYCYFSSAVDHSINEASEPIVGVLASASIVFGLPPDMDYFEVLTMMRHFINGVSNTVMERTIFDGTSFAPYTPVIAGRCDALLANLHGDEPDPSPTCEGSYYVNSNGVNMLTNVYAYMDTTVCNFGPPDPEADGDDDAEAEEAVEAPGPDEEAGEENEEEAQGPDSEASVQTTDAAPKPAKEGHGSHHHHSSNATATSSPPAKHEHAHPHAHPSPAPAKQCAYFGKYTLRAPQCSHKYLAYMLGDCVSDAGNGLYLVSPEKAPPPRNCFTLNSTAFPQVAKLLPAYQTMMTADKSACNPSTRYITGGAPTHVQAKLATNTQYLVHVEPVDPAKSCESVTLSVYVPAVKEYRYLANPSCGASGFRFSLLKEKAVQWALTKVA